MQVDDLDSINPQNWRDSYYAKARSKNANAYDPWHTGEDEKLKKEISEAKTIEELMATHKRSRGAIQSRIKKISGTNLNSQ